MEKLTFYAVSAPEKLDRIGAYLAERLSRDVVRHRYGIRIAGIRGIQGVVRKTVNDELRATIWEPQHMDKIVPSLLFNMQRTEDNDSLLCRHLDHHKLWESNEFAVSCFKIIMYSIQAQYSHHVIQQILGHLDFHKKDSPRIRAGIVQVLLEAVAIAAKGSIGPTVLEVFNTLLRHLTLSVDFELGDRRSSSGSANTKESDERIVQNAIIQTIGFFGSNLPDYQRSEIMMFIMGKVPVFGSSHTLDTSQLGDMGTKRIQIMLLRSLLMVSIGCLIICFCCFFAVFLKLRLENGFSKVTFLFVLFFFRIIPDVGDLKIKREKISRQDVSFMKKHGQQLYRHIYLGCKEEDNVHKNYELLYTALALITIELANEEVVIDLIRVAIALQDIAVTNEDNLQMFSRCSIMALVAAYLNFLSQMIAVPAFCQHVSKVIETRHMDAPYFLPDVIFRDKCSLPKSLEKHDKNVYFLTNKIAESLGGSGYSVERLSVTYVPQVTALFPSVKKARKSPCRSKDEDRLSRRKSIVDTISIQVDIMTGNNTEDKVNTEEITFESLKKAIDNTGMEEQEKEKRRQVIEKFQKAPFEEIAAQCESKANMLHDKLAQILELTIRPPPSPSGTITITAGHAQYQSVPVYEMKFPDLCVY
ncbi:protein EFR3 homolog A [Pyxicephalus adspersus]|uniref:protein EFR3 homolog A n=1 Tax=Pyxicephalus adspersus TaxID=30357 RepID=UPI003B5CE343